MDLFAASGVELPGPGASAARRLLPRSLRVPLFAYKVVEEARGKVVFAPTDAQRAAARDYARKAKKQFGKLKETAVRPILFSEVLGTVLGYRTADPEAPFTLAFEEQISAGSVDVALGRFSLSGGVSETVAPFELKGPTTADLDAVMPGRGRSPVQQAWDYANDAPGARWVLVSNCIELRLYGYGRGREAYELFDLSRLDEEEEHARLWLVLAAERFLGGETEALLRLTDAAYKDVTDKLYADYKGLRDRLISFLTGGEDGPNLPPLAAIEPAQKILDRILFIAFAQRTDLLPPNLLEDAAKAHNKFDPKPYWHNFNNLFRFIDLGKPSAAIPEYNGGLFALDPVVDALVLPDHLAGEVAELGRWDYRREVPVTVLGHIFEQSITDIERLKAEGLGQAPPIVSRRKREGVVYTPDIVTRFLVERTLGLTLRERFDASWQAHGLEQHHGLSQDMGEARELAFWRDYLAVLRAITVVDPACGSGAFLVAAFDALAAEYRRATLRLGELGETIAFDAFDEIVTKNLFGVDLNPESVEITRLSLWLKTARRDHRLQNLEATIKVGDSLIEDEGCTARPFDWRAAFPGVFAQGDGQGGFDIVVGNPPYVRMELLKPIKPYLEKHYAVAADRADLYAYFFERGVGVLKQGGRLGYISSSTFFRTGSGENLRTFLRDRVAVESVVDFGDLQLFEGVTTYPAIVTARRGGDPAAGNLAFLRVGGPLPKDLGLAFAEGARPMPRARLGASSWRFEDEPLARLRDKIAAGRRTLGEVYGAPLYGIKTGLNQAFVVDTPTRDRLVAADPQSADLLKPFLRGENVRRWRVEPEGLWLIDIPFGWTRRAFPKTKALRQLSEEAFFWRAFEARHHFLAAHLLGFEEQARKRTDQGNYWWELRACAYEEKFARPKIIFSHFMEQARFVLDEAAYRMVNKAYMINSEQTDLVALLNSNLFWAVLKTSGRIKQGGYIEAEIQYVSQLPIPAMPDAARARLAALGRTCTDAARARFAIQAAVRHRILDLAPPGRKKLTGRLEAWHALDFAGFRDAVKAAFRTEIPLKERGDWEAYLAVNAAEVRRLSAEIAAAEREIDATVYALFDLAPDEIALLEASLAGQS